MLIGAENSMFNNIPRYGVYGHVHNHTIIFFIESMMYEHLECTPTIESLNQFVIYSCACLIRTVQQSEFISLQLLCW